MTTGVVSGTSSSQYPRASVTTGECSAVERSNTFPGCRQIGETVVMKEFCFGIED